MKIFFKFCCFHFFSDTFESIEWDTSLVFKETSTPKKNPKNPQKMTKMMWL